MNYPFKKVVNYNGNDLYMDTLDVSYSKREIYLTGQINDTVATIINSAVRCLARDSKEPITFFIQGEGGSVPAGLSIYDTVKASGCEICTVACGMAASMSAFLVSTLGTKGKRYIQPNAEMLIHQPLGGVQGQASDMKIHVEHILKTKAKLNSNLSEATGQPIEKIEIDTERDNIMDAEAALAYGLVDIIGDPITEW